MFGQNLSEIWKVTSEIIKSSTSDFQYNLWFGECELVSITAKEATLTTPSNIIRDTIMEHFSDQVADAFKQTLGFSPRIIVLSTENTEADLSGSTLKQISEEKASEVKNNITLPDDYSRDYTFDNFVVGSSNEFAYAAARAVAEKDLDDPETLRKNEYNPLFIYGPSGVGKTHLLYAITNTLASRYPHKKIVYVKGEEFTNQLIKAIREKTTNEFREKYRKIDVLIIDDIQFVAGRDATQLEVFNTFNAVYEERKQIILSSDRPPHEINTLEDRLKTRFLSGLLADVSLPDYDLRLAILQQKVKQNNIFLSSEILKYIAENISSSIRQIEGAIKRLGAIKFLQGGELSMDKVKEAIKDYVTVKGDDSKRFDDILSAVSTKYSVTRDDILSSKRNKEIAFARHICVYIAREITSLSQAQIAKILNRDRSTLVSSEKLVKDTMDKDPSFAYDIKELIRNLQS